jgi:hypothetical protein
MKNRIIYLILLTFCNIAGIFSGYKLMNVIDKEVLFVDGLVQAFTPTSEQHMVKEYITKTDKSLSDSQMDDNGLVQQQCRYEDKQSAARANQIVQNYPPKYKEYLMRRKIKERIMWVNSVHIRFDPTKYNGPAKPTNPDEYLNKYLVGLKYFDSS